MGLDDPYRGALVMRYMEGCAYRDLAARCGVSEDTVRTRLRRGLQILRARMDAHYGGRRAWALPLQTWAAAPRAPQAAVRRPVPPPVVVFGAAACLAALLPLPGVGQDPVPEPVDVALVRWPFT